LQKALKISLVQGARRRINGVKSVSSGAVNRLVSQAEFVESCRRYHQEAAAQVRSMPTIVNGLWKIEGLATTVGKYQQPENTLNDSMFPPEVLGISHVGYGAALTEHVRFDVLKLCEIAEGKSEASDPTAGNRAENRRKFPMTRSFCNKCDPNYRNFTLEGIGSILRIYEPGFFKFMCAWLGLIPRGAPPGPEKTGFFSEFLGAFSPEVQRLITHGYGRLVAFSNTSVYRALQEALSLPPERIEPCVQGIAFAFAMMNSEDMPRLLENSEIPYPAPIRAAFQNGLVYGMIFCDWFVPGFLAEWRSQGPLEEKLVERAREESARNRPRGYPLAFRLENPIVA
jgi:hypothetical protein